MIPTMTIAVVFFSLIVSIFAVKLKTTTFTKAPQKFWKGIAVPLFTTFAVGVLGIAFTVLYDKQKTTDYNNQKNVELLREVLASKDRQDSAFITAVGKRLVLSLERRHEIMLEMKAGKGINAQELTTDQHFEERAAYFFYGMFHVAFIDFYATKGRQLYPRHWMANAFVALADRVDSIVYGYKDPTSPKVPGYEEAALYAYFGHKTPVLFAFNTMLDHMSTKETTPEDDTLRKGCANFQARLNSDRSDKIGHDLEVTIAAIVALDDYAFNKLFGVWYQGPESPAEIKQLVESEIPGKIPRTPPCDYLFYPLRGWPQDPGMRSETWKIIFEAVYPQFQCESRARPAGDCGASDAIVPW